MRKGYDGYYHYLYLITHVPTSKIYIGVRSCKKHPNDDPYMGSGVKLKKICRSELSKVVLSTFDTRELAMVAEMIIVNEEFCLRENTLNCKKGGMLGCKVIDEKSKMKHRLGVQKAREQGKYTGRKKTIDDFRIKQLTKEGYSISKISKMMDISESSVQRGRKSA